MRKGGRAVACSQTRASSERSRGRACWSCDNDDDDDSPIMVLLSVAGLVPREMGLDVAGGRGLSERG